MPRGRAGAGGGALAQRRLALVAAPEQSSRRRGFRRAARPRVRLRFVSDVVGDLELLLQLGALVQRRLVLAIQILALDLELPLLERQRRHDGLVALLEAVDDRVRDGPDVVAGVVDLAPRVAPRRGVRVRVRLSQHLLEDLEPLPQQIGDGVALVVLRDGVAAAAQQDLRGAERAVPHR